MEQLQILMEAGAVVKTAFCGPCFGAGDTPANNAFSIRHSTRNFPNREGSKLQNGQISSVALDGCPFYRSNSSKQGIPDTGNGYGCRVTKDRNITLIRIFMQNRVFDSKGVADPICGDQVWTEYQGLAGNVSTCQRIWF